MNEFEPIKDLLIQFEQTFDNEMNSLKIQIENTKQHLQEVIDKHCQIGLPSIIPDQIIDLMNGEMEQYMIETERIIGNEITKLQQYQPIPFENILLPEQYPLDSNDSNTSILSSELFDEALSSSTALLSLLTKQQ